VLVKFAIAAALFPAFLPMSCVAANTDCLPCHAKIVASYAKTGMGRSFYKPSAAYKPVATLTGSYYHAASDTHFTVFEKNGLERAGKYFQRRWQVDAGGKEINVDEKQIDYVMGSGNHVKTFLHRTAAGALQELPLAWYSERGGYWAMNPGYDTPVQPNSRRKIGYDCMFCHNAYPQIPAGHEQLRAEPLFTGAIPEGIDCQRCHGLGNRHVELAKSANPSIAAIRAAIVNPGRLSHDRQMEVCEQCHLESDSFAFPQILKYDRGQFSYTPGEPLSDFMLFFDHSPSAIPDDRFQIVNSAYRLRMSACLTKSAAALKCTTCHDPHDSNQTTDRYNSICRQCHGGAFATTVTQGRHTALPDCIACHMPKRRTDDVVHAVMTDHYVQRRKPPRDLLADIPEPHGPEIVYRGQVVPYNLSTVAQTPEIELYSALAQVREENNLTRGLEQFSAAIQKHKPKQAEFYIELGDAFVKAGQPEKAIPVYKEALQRNPTSLAAALGLGGAFEKSGDLPGAVESYQRSTQIAPADADSWRRLGEVQMKLGRGAEAADALRRSLELDPEVPQTHYVLATVLSEKMANPASAEPSYREAIRLQPDYSAAHMNLAILLFRGNQAAEARNHFESAIKYHNGYALGHYNFGLMLIAQGQKDEARRQLELALRPGSTPETPPDTALDPPTREAAERRLNELRGRP
jgi:predicted CXXCH cytochrome family protein